MSGFMLENKIQAEIYISLHGQVLNLAYKAQDFLGTVQGRGND